MMRLYLALELFLVCGCGGMDHRELERQLRVDLGLAGGRTDISVTPFERLGMRVQAWKNGRMCTLYTRPPILGVHTTDISLDDTPSRQLEMREFSLSVSLSFRKDTVEVSGRRNGNEAPVPAVLEAQVRKNALELVKVVEQLTK